MLENSFVACYSVLVLQLICRSATQVNIVSEASYNFFQNGNFSAGFRSSSMKNSYRRAVLTGFLQVISS